MCGGSGGPDLVKMIREGPLRFWDDFGKQNKTLQKIGKNIFLFGIQMVVMVFTFRYLLKRRARIAMSEHFLHPAHKFSWNKMLVCSKKRSKIVPGQFLVWEIRAL